MFTGKQTSPKAQQTSRTDKQTGLEKDTEPHDQTYSRYCYYTFWLILEKKEDQVSTNKQIWN